MTLVRALAKWQIDLIKPLAAHQASVSAGTFVFLASLLCLAPSASLCRFSPALAIRPSRRSFSLALSIHSPATTHSTPSIDSAARHLDSHHARPRRVAWPFTAPSAASPEKLSPPRARLRSTSRPWSCHHHHRCRCRIVPDHIAIPTSAASPSTHIP